MTEVVIVVHYMSDAIKTHLADGKKLGLKIEYAEQKGLFGLATL